MIKPTFLQFEKYSPLASCQTLAPQVNSKTAKKAGGLIITSLVDAFSILVIYLLFGSSLNGEEVSSNLGVKIPNAFFSQLIEHDVTLKVKNNQYFLNDKPVRKNQIAEQLREMYKSRANKDDKSAALVVVADQDRPVEELNPILIAASEAGYSQLKMAVQHKGE
jgi:biopolymer transport protein ExbD